jgi:MoaA/NifB/PqqE/SkfB family radical SAM enzyme
LGVLSEVAHPLNSVWKLISQVPLFMLFRAVGWPKMLPINYTLSLLYTCNSRCLTCNIWTKHVSNFSVDEYDATFKSVGETPFWFTLSGGEPFLRPDIVDICKVIYRNCKPGIINIPTNASLYDVIPNAVEEICKYCTETQVVINISIDAVGTRHDWIRGFPGNFEKAMKTYKHLKEMSLPNLTIGIHSVISRFNLEDLEDLVNFVESAKPDSFITEIAEERIELDTVGSPITPNPVDYKAAIDYVMSRIQNMSFKKIGIFTRFFRGHYYELVKQILRKREQVIPCYAGWGSCQISPDGDVWPCCIRGQSIGNLRKHNYNFPSIWFSAQAREIRNSICKKECYCTLANAQYTNILMNPLILLKKVPKHNQGYYQVTSGPPFMREAKFKQIQESIMRINNSRQEMVRGIRFKADTTFEADARFKCLCGTRISVQRGRPLPTCIQCGRADWWRLEALLE